VLSVLPWVRPKTTTTHHSSLFCTIGRTPCQAGNRQRRTNPPTVQTAPQDLLANTTNFGGGNSSPTHLRFPRLLKLVKLLKLLKILKASRVVKRIEQVRSSLPFPLRSHAQPGLEYNDTPETPLFLSCSPAECGHQIRCGTTSQVRLHDFYHGSLDGVLVQAHVKHCHSRHQKLHRVPRDWW
jgi:hypothetical protein